MTYVRAKLVEAFTRIYLEEVGYDRREAVTHIHVCSGKDNWTPLNRSDVDIFEMISGWIV